MKHCVFVYSDYVSGKRIGYHIQNLYEFTLDMADAFTTGFEAGRKRARDNAYRKKKGR